MERLFARGARVAFIGDSITKHGRAVTYVQDYYCTHLPERKVRIYNLGIAGDEATGACQRFDEIMRIHPTEAVVTFGVNDMGVNYYASAEPTEGDLTGRASCILRHSEAICRLAEMLSAEGMPITLCSAVGRDEVMPGEGGLITHGATDALLTMYRENCSALGAGLKSTVDYLTPMQALQAELAAIGGPSLFSPDRTHPSPLGQEVMACVFLASQGLPVGIPSAAAIAAGWRLPPFSERVRRIHCKSQIIRNLHYIYPHQSSCTEGMDLPARIAYWRRRLEEAGPPQTAYDRYFRAQCLHYVENAAHEEEYAAELEEMMQALYPTV